MNILAKSINEIYVSLLFKIYVFIFFYEISNKSVKIWL